MRIRLLLAVPALLLLGACGRQSEEAKAPAAPPAPVQRAAPAPAAQPAAPSAQVQQAAPAPPAQTATPPATEPAPPQAAADKAETQPAERQVNVTSPAPPPPPRTEALASGRIKNFDWRLTKVKVTGAILTVEFEGEGKCCSSERLPLSEVSYIDDSTARKFTVLKDESGQWMAAPLLGKDAVNIQAQGGVTKTWFKFPAPPPEATTVSLNIPNLGAIDGVPVQR